jgi:hypothetical protein
MEDRRKNPSLSTALGVTGAIVLYIISGIALWLALNSYVAPTSIKDPAKAASAKKDILQTAGLFMAGVAGGVGVYFTWQNLKQSQDALQHTQKSTERNLRLAWKSQITDRFTHIPHLLVSGFGYFMSHETHRCFFGGVADRGFGPPGNRGGSGGPDRPGGVHRCPAGKV